MAAGTFAKSHPTDGSQDVFNTGQVVSAQMLADMQATLNGLVGQSSAGSAVGAGHNVGVYALTVDGVGGTTKSQAAGTVTIASGLTVSAGGAVVTGAVSASTTMSVGSTASGTTAPTPTPASGTMYKDSIALMWAQINDGTLVRGFNISSVVKNSTGSYTINLINAASSATICGTATANNTNTFCQFSAGNSTTCAISSFLVSTQAAANCTFFVIAFG